MNNDHHSIILQTKLHAPQPRKDTLVRPRLLEWVKANLEKPLILLSAPAGYGKTTLLIQLTASISPPVIWYQLDHGDNDPAIFFEYFIESITAHFAKFGSTSRSLLHSIQNITAEWQRFLVVFLNEVVETIPEDFLVVLEDYHLIENPVIHSFIDRFLAQAPSQVHLLLSTRSDPLISLARLRARGQIAEVRADQLRFTSEEIRSLLTEILNLDLPVEHIETLAHETEGWVVALQLALSSLMHQGYSVQSFTEGFSGSNRYLFDYLTEEVLATQSPKTQSFLLSSSILDQMNPNLCNKLLDIGDAGEILEALESQNLFIIALDDQRQWYRYHHLFRDFLQKRLQRRRGDQVQTLHRRAGVYFEAVGDIDRAIYHYQIAANVEKLADLIEQAAPTHLTHGRLRTVHQWLEMVPEEVLGNRPWLVLYRGMVLAIWGQTREARLLLTQARSAFAMTNDALGESRALNQLCRVALYEGRYEESLTLNQEALSRMPQTDHEGHAQALREQAELWVYLGNSKRAIETSEQSLDHSRHLGNRAVIAERTMMLGVAYAIAGRLSKAIRTMKRGLTTLPNPDVLGAHIVYSQLGMVHLTRWELDQAIDYYQRSLTLSQKFQDPAFIIYAYTDLGEIFAVRNELDRAQNHFDAALALLEQTELRSLLAEIIWNYQAELHVKAGRYTQAEACSRKAIRLRGNESGGLAWGMGWLGLAKTYLATGRLDEAERILLDVAAASEQGGIAFVFIDSAFELARLYLTLGRDDEATSFIARVLDAAAPERHRWWFLVHGGETVPILIHALKHKIEPAFVQELLTALGETARPELIKLLNHPDVEVCRYAGELLPSRFRSGYKMTTMAIASETLQVTCFGEFVVTCEGQEVGKPGWMATKAGDLFAYFITFRGRSIPRERVLEALWPEISPDQSTGAFHTTLYKMRKMLQMSGRQEKFVWTRNGEYFLDKDLLWIDADNFTILNDHSSKHQHQAIEMCQVCVENLKRAVKLYQGDYLENLYYDWALDERRSLRELYLNALQILAQYHAGRDDYEAALSYGQQILAKDPLQENVHCEMMRYYNRLGDRKAVIGQYQQLEAVLADELGIEPLLETQKLFQTLLNGEQT